MKSLRQSAILRLIESEHIETQEELGERLTKLGYNVTQATLSRDIQELQLIKVAEGNKRYRYSISAAKPDDTKYLTRFRTIFVESVQNVAFAQNIVVIKTLTGMAQAAAAAIDAMSLVNVVGTIAGDDTIFVLMRDAEQAESLTSQIKSMLK